jgi:hypothetical protein
MGGIGDWGRYYLQQIHLPKNNATPSLSSVVNAALHQKNFAIERV